MISQSQLPRKASTSRRKMLKWGLWGLGAAALAATPKALAEIPLRPIRTLTFNADDIGILNFALLLEELESAFYAAVARSGKITDPREADYVRALGVHEATHVTFLRNVLGNDATFQTYFTCEVIPRAICAALLTGKQQGCRVSVEVARNMASLARS